MERVAGKTVFYMARLASHEYNLRMMARTVGEQLGIRWLERARPGDLPASWNQ